LVNHSTHCLSAEKKCRDGRRGDKHLGPKEGGATAGIADGRIQGIAHPPKTEKKGTLNLT